MPLKMMSAVMLAAVALSPANADEADRPLEGLQQIAAIMEAARPLECPIQPLVDPPSLVILAFEIDEPPEGDLAIEVRLSLTPECTATAARALQAARDQLVVNGLRAIGLTRSSNAIVVYYGG